MKIAFILPSLANKGPVLVCRDIVAQILPTVETCVVFYFDDILEIDFDCRTEKINFFSMVNLNQFDIVHSHMFRPDLFLFYKSIFNKRFISVTTIHTDISKDLQYAYGRVKSLILPLIWRMAWNSFDKIVVLTNYALSNYSYLKPKKYVIPNGRFISSGKIDTTDDNFFKELKSKYSILGTVVSYDDRKGLDQVIRVLNKLPDFVFIIVGDGNTLTKKKLIRLAIENMVSERVFFIGKKDEGSRYMSQFDIFVIPSISEGFPLALLEATGLKVPVVCSDIPVFTESFSNEEVSFFELYNIDSFKEAILRAMFHRSAFKQNAYQAFNGRYSLEIMGNNYSLIYNNNGL